MFKLFHRKKHFYKNLLSTNLIILAAGVPGRAKNWFICNTGNRYRCTSSTVCSKSCFASFGNPQIMSVATVRFPLPLGVYDETLGGLNIKVNN